MILLTIAAVAVIAVVLAWSIARKIRIGGSCCGEHEAAPRTIVSADTDKNHYAHNYTLTIEGMVCGACLRRVENAFNSCEGFYASGELQTKTVTLYTKAPLTRKQAAEMLGGTTYTLVDLEEVK